ncbi:MAG: FAD-binding protein [Chloroflexi bacterium]|nr:MAG: FAD-binding protein [Chloroflexota bacterium]
MIGQRSLEGFCAALLPPEAGGPPPHQLAVDVARYLDRLPAALRHTARAGFAGIDALALVTTGHRLRALDVERRERALGRASRGVAGLGFEGLKALVLLVAGSERFTDEILTTAASHPPARPDADLTVIPAGEWPSLSRADVVVVGSGAGGAMAARTLARAGLDTVIVEEGARHSVEEFRSTAPLERFAGLYRDAGATAALGRPPIALPIGRGVGGTTLVNSGTCYRTPDSVLTSWRDDQGLTLADPAAFSPLLDEVEATLQVAPVPDAVMGRNGALMLEGARALGWGAGPLLRNAPGCGGCCQCSIGCPRNAKFGVHLNALPQACAAGARILSDARVERILVTSGRAAGVVARGPDGSSLTLLARRVVVAAGATETPPLLRRSGLGRHRMLGRNLSIHPALGVAGRFDEPVFAWRGVLQSAAVEEFHRDGILIEATSTPPGMGSLTLPGHGRALLRELERAQHLATLGAMVADLPRGRVLGARRALITYRLARGDGRVLLRAVDLMGQLLFAAGAREVFSGLARHPVVRSAGELAEAVAATSPAALHLAAFHPTGTAAAGNDPERHPVDPEGRLRGVDGLWVADGSLLPTCATVNPQVTIMALALAVADRVAAS